MPAPAPDPTAVRVALWRALHVLADAPPHVLADDIGLRLAGPDPSWRLRPDMDLAASRPHRAAIVARARFLEDTLAEQCAQGVRQYVLLGAGLDTLAQRRPELASQLQIFEVDRPGPQAWKRQRLLDLGFPAPPWLHFVPVDFEAGEAWPALLATAGFDRGRPALAASTGVSLYLTRAANAATLRQIASFAPGSSLVLSFVLPPERLDPSDRPGFEAVIRRAAAAGTPFRSLFTPEEIVALAQAAGLRQVRHISAAELNKRYFASRSDGLRLSRGEELLTAAV